MDSEIKSKALADFLGCEADDVFEATYGDETFEAEGGEYLVLTDEEADDAARERISESLWAFNASFIVAHADLPSEAEEMIRGFQEAKCEGANDTIRGMIKDLDHFVNDAVACDGRGHFLAGYDGEENEAVVTAEDGTRTYLFIFRTN